MILIPASHQYRNSTTRLNKTCFHASSYPKTGKRIINCIIEKQRLDLGVKTLIENVALQIVTLSDQNVSRTHHFRLFVM